MKPTCFNRPPRLAGRFAHRLDSETGEIVRTWIGNDWFTDRCAQHDGRGVGPNGESFAVAHGFECAGCRWLPGVTA